MATAAGIKIKTKQTRVRNPAFHDEKYTGSEPHWDGDEDTVLDAAEFDSRLRKSFYYYNYYYNQKDTKKYVVEWAKTQKDFSKQDVSAFIRAADRTIPMTACSLIMANRAGMPLKERHIEFLKSSIRESINLAEPEVVDIVKTPEQVVKAPTIQDRLQEKTGEIIGEIEGIYDDVTRNIRVDFKPYDYLTANNVVQSQLGKYVEVYTARKIELEAAMSKVDADLKEGYAHYKATDFKRLITWIDNLLAAVEQYRGVKKATKKARVKKAPTKEKVVAKLKYCKTDTVLKLVSINPAEIIGATELWTYNTKTRKLGKYVATAYQTLTVKNSTIVNFDTDKSVMKTLRKPEEKLKEFARAGKIQLRKFIEDIRATEAKLNGRINTETVLLKAV